MSYPPRSDLPPSPGQLAAIAAYARHHSWAAAAHALGIAESTAKNHAEQLYRRLGVSGANAALEALGWLAVPSDPGTDCGVVGTDSPG